MSRKYLVLFVLSTLMLAISCVNIEELIQSMSIEEKCGQMTQITFDVIQKQPSNPADADDDQIDEQKLLQAIKDYHVGSILNTPLDTAQKASTWHKIITKVQDMALKEGKSKIPVLYGIDSIHGGTYIRESVLFPQPLAMGATFNTEIASQVARVTAVETRAVGIPWNFNPVLDVGRQPLWPRLWETYGEDPYVAIKMGESYIRSHQGNDLRNRSNTATCMKHYIGYSYPFNGRDRTPSLIPENLLREVFLPPFEAAVKAGSPTVMINSGDVNGVPGHANGYYINDILKGELKFEGFAVSDWEDIKRLHWRDHVADSPQEAVRIAVMNGVDMSMVPSDYSFYDHCVDIAQNDTKFFDRVNDAVHRILKVKDQLGLFEDAYPVEGDLEKIGTTESEEMNLDFARESIVLAKNEKNILPLKKNEKRILVTGPTAHLLKTLNGGWSYSWRGEKEENFQQFGRKKQTIVDALRSRYTDPDQVEYVEGANFETVTDLSDALAAADAADVIVMCLGEDTYIETQGNIDSLLIGESQEKMADALFQKKKPVVLVYVGGRPRIITDIANKADAILFAFLPGTRGGEAIADVIFGDYNPSGRLPITYPKATNGYTTYDHKFLEDLNGNTYDNLYPFAHGLSYTSFSYSDLVLSAEELEAPSSLGISVKVTNTGERSGKEAVILYLTDEFASVSRPVKQVKGFQKIALEPKETKTVFFGLTIEDMKFFNLRNQKVYEPGKFNIAIGDLKSSFNLVEPQPDPTTTPTINTEVTTSAAAASSTTPKSTVSTTKTTTRAATTTESSASQIQFNVLALIALCIVSLLFV